MSLTALAILNGGAAAAILAALAYACTIAARLDRPAPPAGPRRHRERAVPAAG